MSRNASGTYTKPASTDAVSGQTASSTAYNTLMDDLASEMTDSLSRAGKGALTADMDAGSNLINNVTDPVSAQDAATKNYVDAFTIASVTAKTASTYTVVAGDINTIIACDASSNAISVALTAAATLGDGFRVTILVTDATNAVTIDPDGSETINGATTLVLSDQWDSVTIECDGTTFNVFGGSSRGSVTALEADRMTLTKHTVYFDAGGMLASQTNGAGDDPYESGTNNVNSSAKTFDDAATEYAEFKFVSPKSWDEGTVTAIFYWCTRANTGNVVWGIEATSTHWGDADDPAWGTGIEVTGNGASGTYDNQISPETAAITIGNSPEKQDILYFRVYRNYGDAADTLTGDAYLTGVTIFYTMDATDDA